MLTAAPPTAADWGVTVPAECAAACRAAPATRTAAADAAVAWLNDMLEGSWLGCRVVVARWCGPWPCVSCPQPGLDLAPLGPLASLDKIRSVDLAGTVTDHASALWRVDDGRWLVWQTGATAVAAGGPVRRLHQDPTAAAGDPGTWWLEATRDSRPPADVLAAASELSCEILRAASGQTCRIAGGVESISRQGETIRFRPPSATDVGVPSVNLALMAHPRQKPSTGLLDPAPRGVWRVEQPAGLPDPQPEPSCGGA